MAILGSVCAMANLAGAPGPALCPAPQRIESIFDRGGSQPCQSTQWQCANSQVIKTGQRGEEWVELK